MLISFSALLLIATIYFIYISSKHEIGKNIDRGFYEMCLNLLIAVESGDL